MVRNNESKDRNKAPVDGGITTSNTDHEYTVPGASPDTVIPVMQKKVAFVVGLLFLIVAVVFALFVKSSPKIVPPTTYLGSRNPQIHHDAYEFVESPDNNQVAEQYYYDLGISELQSNTVLYRHKNTGALFASIVPIIDSANHNQEDEVFAISFSTRGGGAIVNNHGTARVLQRSILHSGGSRNYPMKHPLNEIQKQIPLAFQKATTTNDQTTYVVAASAAKDIYNLMSIYMDLVFQPIVIMNATTATRKRRTADSRNDTNFNNSTNTTTTKQNTNYYDNRWIFRQEGWRVELDSQGQPKFNGVVYNERKNAFSDPEELLFWHTQATLFNNTSYQYSALGDPKEIIHYLTREELKDFHHRIYHPSNARFLFYGSKESMTFLLHHYDEFMQQIPQQQNQANNPSTSSSSSWSSSTSSASSSSMPELYGQQQQQQQPHVLEQQQQTERDRSIVSIPYPSSTHIPSSNNNTTRTTNSSGFDNTADDMYVMTTWLISDVDAVDYEEYFFDYTDYYYSSEEDMIMDEGGKMHSIEVLIELTWNILDELLMGKPLGILYRAIMDSGAGSQVVGNGLNKQSTFPWMFHVGLAGIPVQPSSSSDDDNNYYDTTQSIVDLIQDTLYDVAEAGFLPEEINRAMNIVDFELHYRSTGDLPRGYPVVREVMEKWNRGYDDPFMNFRFDWQWTRLKKVVDNHGSDFFVDLVRNYFLADTTKVTIELYPSDALKEQNQQEEQNMIMELRRDFEELLKETSDLKLKQTIDDPPEVLASISMPTYSFYSINNTSAEYNYGDPTRNHSVTPIRVDTNAYDSGVTVVYHEVSSKSDIIYADFGLDISRIDVDDIVLLQLLEILLVQTGTDQLDDFQVANDIDVVTGGIKGAVVIQPIRTTNDSQVSDEQNMIVPTGEYLSTKFFFRGTCTESNIDRLFDLFRVMYFERTDYYKILLIHQDLVVQLLKSIIFKQEKKIRLNGHYYGQRRVQARYSVYGFVSELYDGIATHQKLQDILEVAVNDWENLSGRINRMFDNIVNMQHRNGMVLSLTGEKSVLDAIKESVKDFVTKRLPPYSHSQAPHAEPFPDFSTTVHPWVNNVTYQQMAAELPIRDEGIVVTKMTSTQDGHVTRGGSIYRPGEVIQGSSDLITQCIEKNLLFKEIQIKLGSHEVTADLSRETGLLLFSTFQDPNITGTLGVYESLGSLFQAEMRTDEEDDRQLPLGASDSILTTITEKYGTELHPDVMGWKSVIQWLSGITPNIQNQWQDSVLNSNYKDFVEYANHLQSLGQPSIAIIASSAAINNAMRLGDLNLTLIYI